MRFSTSLATRGVALLGAAVFLSALPSAGHAARPVPPLRQLVRVDVRTPQDMRDLQILDLDMTESVGTTFADFVATQQDEQTAANIANHGIPFHDPSDPLLTNGARVAARTIACPLLCCPMTYGAPPGDGEHPWFRP